MIKLKGGSYATTYKISNNVVRKIVSKKIDPLRGSLVLKGQYKWLNFAKKCGLFVPNTIKFEDNMSHTLYDMHYIKNSQLFSEKLQFKESVNLFKKIIINLKSLKKLNLFMN